MKRAWALLASLWIAGCGGNDEMGAADASGSGNGGTNPDAASSDGAGTNPEAASSDAGETSDAGEGDALLVDSPVDSPSDVATNDVATNDAAPVDTTPTLLLPGTATLSGITSDDYVIYRDAGGTLSAIRAEAGASPRSIVVQTGNTNLSIRGRVVFAFSNVDYTTNAGDLTVWTATGGAHFVGKALFAEEALAATDDGAHILYATGASTVVEDVVVASSDFSRTQTLVAGAGRGTLTTCTASFGFGGAHAFVAFCAPGSTAATLKRFDAGTELPVDGGVDAADAGDAGLSWVGTVIATGVQPVWAADRVGKQVMYVTAGAEARLSDGTTNIHIDSNVNSGTFTPDGMALLYTVGDQLRRTSISSVNPLPVVTYGYSQRDSWSPDLSYSLYSTNVVYTPAEHRDLRLASTASLNATPDILVAQPVANLTLSSFTSDSKYVLYLTDVTNGVGTLDFRATAGGPVSTVPSVVSASAAAESKVIVADNRSDPSLYPITARVSVIDLARGVAPQVLQTKVLDSGSFLVNHAGDHVVYVLSSTDPEAGAGQGGIYLQAIP